MLRRALLAATPTSAARAVAARFVAGESMSDAVAAVRELRDAGMLGCVGYLGDGIANGSSAAANATQYIQLLDKLAAEGLTAGGAAEVSVTPAAVGLRADAGLETAIGNIERIAAAAESHGTSLTLDAEDHRTAESTLRIAAELRRAHPSAGSVVQAALRRTETDVRDLAAVPGTRVRLVKGAYPEPLSEAFTGRHDVDKAFARCLKVLMSGPGYPMIATHDRRLIAITRALGMDREPGTFEYQLLYGVREDLARQLVSEGAKVRIYVPYGPGWPAYLRRLTEQRPLSVASALRTRAR